MLLEIPNVRQIAGEDSRRWFSDEYFDLIVWYERDSISGFQLCYDRTGRPRAYTWTRSQGARHAGIDDGDDPLLTYKATPILVADGDFDAAEVGRRFKRTCRSLPPDIRSIVISQLEKEGKRLPADRLA